MIEISFTEIVLFAWAIIATGYALKHKHERNTVNSLLHHVIVDPDVYNKIHDGWKESQRHAS